MKRRVIRFVVLFFMTVPMLFMFSGCSGGYRSISVAALSGSVSVDRLGKSAQISAYEGMKLQDQDVVTVSDPGSVVLKLDDDKYVYLESGAEIKITASGRSTSTKTNIELLKGSMSSVIEKKLGADENFSVTVDNVSMVVRGTIFRICLVSNENGDTTVTVQTIEGEVAIDTGNDTQSILSSGFQDVILLTDAGGTFESINTPIEYNDVPSDTLQWIQEALQDKLNTATDPEEINLLNQMIAVVRTDLPTAVPATPTTEPTQTHSPTPLPTETPTDIPTNTPTIYRTRIPPTPTATQKPEENEGNSNNASPVTVKYTLTIVQPTEGGVVNGTAGEYESGTQIALDAAPSSGYELTGWLVNSTVSSALGTGTSITYTMPGENTTVSAAFSLITYSLSYEQPSQGGGSISMTAGDYAPGAVIHITVVPDSQMILDSLVINGVQDVSYSALTEIDYTMPGEDVVISAVFRQTF